MHLSFDIGHPQQNIGWTLRHHAIGMQQLVDYIARINVKPTKHIGYFGSTREEVEGRLNALSSTERGILVAAYSGVNLIGVLLADTESDPSVCLLHGPLVDGDNWDLVADCLLERLEQELDAHCEREEMLIECKHAVGMRFAARHRFRRISVAQIFVLERADFRNTTGHNVLVYDEAHFGQVQHLHDHAFGKSSPPAVDLISRLNQDFQLLVATNGDEVTGYLYFERFPLDREGFLQYICVKPHKRDADAASRLVNSAVERIFEDQRIMRVSLSTSLRNGPAIRLATSVGFLKRNIVVRFERERKPLCNVNGGNQ